MFLDLSACRYIVYAMIQLWFIRNVLFKISGVWKKYICTPALGLVAHFCVWRYRETDQMQVQYTLDAIAGSGQAR